MRVRGRDIHPARQRDFLARLNPAYCIVGWIPTVVGQGVAAWKLFIWEAQREPALAIRNPQLEADWLSAKCWLSGEANAGSVSPRQDSGMRCAIGAEAPLVRDQVVGIAASWVEARVWVPTIAGRPPQAIEETWHHKVGWRGPLYGPLQFCRDRRGRSSEILELKVEADESRQIGFERHPAGAAPQPIAARQGDGRRVWCSGRWVQ